jgi:hypothetical protein
LLHPQEDRTTSDHWFPKFAKWRDEGYNPFQCPRLPAWETQRARYVAIA